MAIIRCPGYQSRERRAAAGHEISIMDEAGNHSCGIGRRWS